MGWAWHVATMGEMRKSYKRLVGKSDGRRPLGCQRWEDNIKMHFKGLCGSGLDLIGS